MPNTEMLDELEKLGATCELEGDVSLHDGFDVAYVNRLQEERFEEKALFEKNRLKYRLTKPDVEGSGCLILDPLPRIDEICTEVDALPNAAYFKQASYGNQKVVLYSKRCTGNSTGEGRYHDNETLNTPNHLKSKQRQSVFFWAVDFQRVLGNTSPS